MSWVYLLLGILFEVAGTTCMKLSKGFSHVGYSGAVFLFYGVSLALVTLAIRRIELSVAYAIWAGVGIALISLIGLCWFDEQISAVKILCLTLVLVGVVGLQLTSPELPAEADNVENVDPMEESGRRSLDRL